MPRAKKEGQHGDTNATRNAPFVLQEVLVEGSFFLKVEEVDLPPEQVVLQRLGTEPKFLPHLPQLCESANDVCWESCGRQSPLLLKKPNLYMGTSFFFAVQSSLLV